MLRAICIYVLPRVCTTLGWLALFSHASSTSSWLALASSRLPCLALHRPYWAYSLDEYGSEETALHDFADFMNAKTPADLVGGVGGVD